MQNKNTLTEKPTFKINIKCLTCTENNCQNCRHAIREPHKIYCTKMREYIKQAVNCPEFEFEPAEYKLFIRI